MNLLNVNGVTKHYGPRAVLQNVSFSVRQGEVLGLIGPNGAGKTTLFECLAGLLPADAGVVQWEDRPLPAAQRKDALFYIPDGISPWAEQKLGWTLDFFARLYGSKVKPQALLDAFKLASLKQARLGTLSKGERKRALLALGLLTPQPLLMLDEPFDGLDLRQTREVMTLLRSHVERGRTLLLSVHQLIDAARVCDRLVLLSEGRCAGIGTLDELRAQAKLAEGNLEDIFLALT
ncbi:MAG: ABC transporter ATP-binding protein [Acidobacteria bacterium]|nr:ABC transporter ATP-binding protein [Acidobacteriota bacterium]MBI3425219.1 ABC transporter ATP-binding protein [Acidobacteriota bacterium]